jgi:hypothetical protein
MPDKFKILKPEVVEEALFKGGKSRNGLIEELGNISHEIVHKAMRGEPVPSEIAYKIIITIEKLNGKTDDDVDFDHYIEKLSAK